MNITKAVFLLTAVVLVLAIAGACVQAAPAANAQHEAELPLCDPDLVDTTFTFASLPAGGQTISLHFQNKGYAACRLQGQPGPSFSVDGHSMMVPRCWLCDQINTPLLPEERERGNQILLAPGGRAVVDLHWASTGESCQWADWANFFVSGAKPAAYLFVPSNWPMHICSDVKSSGYRAEANSSSAEDPKDGQLHISVTPAPIYSDEYATLHVELAVQRAAGPSPAGCASLYTVRYGASIGGTRFEPLSTVGYSSRPSYTTEQIKEDNERAWPSWRKDRWRKCDIPDGEVTADAAISAENLANVTHIEWRTLAGPGQEPVFLTATTHFTVLDVDTLAPNWGDPVEGVRAGLSIDKESFKLGERIPLHLRWENVNAALPLAQGECMEPQPALEIQDSEHKVVRTIPMIPVCTGHGWGPFTIQKGKPQRIFIEFATTAHTESPMGYLRGELPGPGVYYLISVWSPSVFETSNDATDNTPRIGSPGRFGKVYATTRSLPVRVEVTP